jgi:hypothetical protein
MPSRPKRRFWRVCRIYFRRVRITVWLLILALICCLTYLNQVGLPGFVKRPLLQKLRDRGLDLQFSRLRLSWYHGIVAENVRFGRADEPLAPQLTAAEVQVKPNYQALAHLHFAQAFSQIDSLVLRQGRLVWPIAETPPAPARELWVTNLQAVLRLLPNDQWVLDKFQGSFAGGTFQLSGTLTNASAIRDWKFLRPSPGEHPAPSGTWRERFRHLADTLDRIQFSAPPDLRLDLRGDARDIQSFSLRTTLSAPGAQTPWGNLAHGKLTLRLIPAVTNEVSRMDLVLHAGEAQTPWANTSDLHLDLHLASLIGPTNAVDGDLTLTAGRVHTQWASATNAHLAVQWVHALTNPIPLTGRGALQVEQGSTAWGRAQALQLRGTFTHSAVPSPDTNAAWGFWAQLQPYIIDWEAQLTNLASPYLLAQEVACKGSWAAPELTVTNFTARLYQGRCNAQAGLNVATRALHARLASDFEPHQLAPLLGESGRYWLAKFSWDQPPTLQAEGAVTLPSWTNSQPDWRGEVLPSLQVQGELNFPGGIACSNVVASALGSHFSYSNLVWRLADLHLTRPEGELRASLQGDQRTQEFYARIGSTIDPRCIRPLLGKEAQPVFELASFTQPPVLEAELWGRFNDPESLGAKGRVALTNFTFRGQTASSVETAVQYTNRVLQFLQPRVRRGEELMTADGLAADFNRQLAFLTNGFSTGDPMVITRAIGPHVAKAIEPYHFLTPPTGHVHGTIPLHGEEGADLYFEVTGGPFQWMKFNIPHLSGQIHWLGETLTLTNVTADFYGGLATGNAQFEFWPGSGADFSLHLSTTDTQLRDLLTDINGHTNKIEGRLTGTLNITKANTEDPQHVQGFGNASLRDGLIWEIPLFGAFTPVLNEVHPGLGSSRFNAGTCTYTITNSVIRSEDLEMRSPAVRLFYRGTVDFDYRVNARVEAEPLSEFPLLGPVLRTAALPFSKLFVYKVTGTLDDPKKEPILPAKLFITPFKVLTSPLRTIKDLFPEDSTSSRTNAPLVSPKNPGKLTN